MFDALRQVRLRLARDRGVPPYVIFHDTTLRDMVERRPRTLEQLHEVYGVGLIDLFLFCLYPVFLGLQVFFGGRDDVNKFILLF